MKRKSDLIEMESNGSASKKKRIHTEFYYNDKLNFLSELSDNLTQCISSFYPNIDVSQSEIVIKAKNTANIIPTIVTIGKQSAGKSSMYAKTFGIKHIIGTGISTRCPIIYRFGPNYQDKIYVKEYYTNTIVNVNNVSEAENIIENYSKNNNHPIVNAEIICEMHNVFNSSMIDLPGFVDDIHYQPYFNDLKKKYINKKETIILHVAKADDDRETDISIKFLNDCNNTIITILTHADYWVADKEKIRCAEKHLSDPRVKNIAIMCNLENENDVLNGMNLKFNTTKDIIITSTNLKKYILLEVTKKTTELYPEIELCVEETLISLNKELSIIGRQTPDMREACAQLRNYYTDKIKNEFNSSGSELSPLINSIREIISPQIINKLCSLVPSYDHLAMELKAGRRREVQGTEGWDSITKKYIGLMINQLKNEYAYRYAQTYIKCLGEYICMRFQQVYKPYSKGVQDELIEFVKEISYDFNIKALAEASEFLDSIANDPYNADDNYINNYSRSLIEEQIKHTIDYFVKSKNKSTSVEEASKDPSVVIDYVQKMIGDNGDQYKLKAKSAYHQISNFWKSESVHIHNNLIEIMSKYERAFEMKLLDRIQLISHDNLAEPERTEAHRVALIELANLCENILDK